MAYNLGTNIGAVENGNPTGQAYATKIIRTLQLSTTLTANAISTNGCILASDGTDLGYKAISVTTPYMNGTKPKHLTIQNVRVSTNSTGLYASGMGVIILPSIPTGVFNRSNCQLGANTSSLNMAYLYQTASVWVAFSSDTYRTGLYPLNQIISTSNNSDITNLYVILLLGTTAFTPVAGTIVNIQIDVNFE
jgi:hypothetical protein